MVKNSSFNSLEGKIILASPKLGGDNFFEKSVVYIFMHNENGTCGVVLNQKIDEIGRDKLNEISKQINKKSIPKKNVKGCEKNIVDSIPIMFGGPVHTQFYMALTSKEELEDKNNYITLYLNMKVFMDDYIHKKLISNCVLIKGMSTWEPGQLEREINNNNWILTDTDLHTIFYEVPDKRWQTLAKKIGINDSIFITSYTGNA